MGSITYKTDTRKNGLNLLGEGCRDCNVRDKCFMDKCNKISYSKREGVSDLTNRYNHYKNELGFECYARKYKYGYFLIVKGEKYKSGEVDLTWHIHFYEENMESCNCGMSNDGYEVEKRGKRYLYIRYMKENYGINDMIPLEDGNGIILY